MHRSVFIDKKGNNTGRWFRNTFISFNKGGFQTAYACLCHGFLNLTDDVEFRYKCDNAYNKASEGGMRYDAPEVNVDWGTLLAGIEPVLSEKDTIGPTLADSDNQFIYGENC